MPLPKPMGYASFDLGLGSGLAGLGDNLAAQVQTETEEERRRRLTRQQQMSLLGPAAMTLGLNGNGSIGA